MTFVVEHDGTKTEFPDETLLIFIDETGHESFADPNVPVFGFGGCLSMVPLYPKTIAEPWTVVESHFPEEMTPLHAANLAPDKLSQGQLTAISSFFEDNPFGRFAPIASVATVNETEQDLFHIMARITFARILEIVRNVPYEFQQVVMLFEHSQRTDHLMADYFRRYSFSRMDGQTLPCFYATQTKADEMVHGLTVADFVAHTAGGEVRSRLRGGKEMRRDFRSVFVTSDPAIQSFMMLNRATGKD